MEKKYSFALLGLLLGVILTCVACGTSASSVESLLYGSLISGLPFAFIGFLIGSLIDKK